MRKLTKVVEYRTNAAVFVKGKDRPIVLGLNPEGIVVTVRALGLRGKHVYPIKSIYVRAAEASAEAARERRGPYKVKRGNL